MKKNIILTSLVLIFGLTGCGRNLELTTPIKNPADLNENIDALSISVSDFSSFATTFSMFWIPEEKELTWKTSLYKPSDKYETKVARIMNNIIRKSDEFDLYDKKIIELNKVKAPLTERYEELECDFDYRPECEEIDTKLKEITANASVTLKLPDGTEKQVDYEGYKSFLIEEIQATVDEYNFENPETNQPKNWMLYGDAPVYEILQNADKTFNIAFPTLGPFGSQNAYSTIAGEIYNVELKPSIYNNKIELLTFKIKEKGADGNFTGLTWEYTLERSFMVGKLRYKGDVLKVNSKGQVLRRGVCKVDFAKKGT